MAVLGSNSNNINVMVSSSADTKGIDDTSKSLHNLDSSSQKASTGQHLLGAAARAATIAVAALGAGVAAAGFTAIKSAGEFEQNRVAFDTMLGSADKARQLMTEISQFAKSTPFELPEVVQGSKQLLAFGIAQQEIIPTMRRLGDIASGVGVPVGQLAYVFGQVRVAGKLMGGDLMQFTNAGVPMIEGLSKVLKVSQGEVKQMVEQGKVGFKEVDQVIKNMTGTGSQFGGMMEKQSKTFDGVVSNIKDSFGQILRSAVGVSVAGDIVKDGVFDRIKSAAQAAMPKLQEFSDAVGPAMSKAMEQMGAIVKQVVDYLNPKIQVLAQTFKFELLPVLMRLWKEVIEPLAPVIGTVLVGAFGLLIDTLSFLMPILAGLTTWLVDNKEFVMGIAIAVGVLWATMKITEGINAFIGGFNLAKTAAITAIAEIRGAQGLGGLHANLATFAGWGLFAAAAAGAFIAIQEAARQTRQVLDESFRNVSESFNTVQTSIRQLGDLVKHGTPEQKKRALESLDRMKKQGFGSYASGGFTGRGGENEVAGIVHKGEYVLSKEMVDQSSGLPKSVNNNSTSSTTYNINTVQLMTPDAVAKFFEINDRNSLLASNGLSIQRAG